MKPNIPNLIRWLRGDDNRMPHVYFNPDYSRANTNKRLLFLTDYDEFKHAIRIARVLAIPGQKVTKRYILIANYRSEK